MGISKCPGQDMKFWKPTDIYEVICQTCGTQVEFWKDDVSRKCQNCGSVVRNPKFNLGCAAWCKFAKQCFGDSLKTIESNEKIEKKGEPIMATSKIKRKIIKIDENKCDGCGLCMPSCPEQAIQIVDGKAKLVKEFYCDGLGACLGACPTGALTIEEREAEVYDDDATIARIKEVAPEMLETHIKHIKDHVEPQEKHHAHKHGVSACPSANAMSWKPNASETKANQGRAASELNQWPIQLHLVSPMAPYFNNADLLIVADCVPFAYANFHQDFLSGKAIVIGCPKLDDVEEYKEKLTEMFGNANIKSIKVIHMEVPCCFGLSKLVKDSIASSGKKIPFEEKIIGIKGD